MRKRNKWIVTALLSLGMAGTAVATAEFNAHKDRVDQWFAQHIDKNKNYWRDHKQTIASTWAYESADETQTAIDFSAGEIEITGPTKAAINTRFRIVTEELSRNWGIKLNDDLSLSGKDKEGQYHAKTSLPVSHNESRYLKYQHLFEQAATEFDLDPALLYAVAHVESRFNPRALSHKGAVGIMQLMPQYGAIEASPYLNLPERELSRFELMQPELNIRLGAAYLHHLRKTTCSEVQQDLQLSCMLTAYNWGPSRTERLMTRFQPTSAYEYARMMANHAPLETDRYVHDVHLFKRKYEQLG
jgi:hypothetical protein